MAADDVTKLRRYCAENFAASVVFVDSPERASAALAEVVWLATRDRTRAVTSHRRSARAVLAKLHIPTAGLKGTWLVLGADEAVRVAAAQHRVDRPMQLRHQAQSTSVASRITCTCALRQAWVKLLWWPGTSAACHLVCVQRDARRAAPSLTARRLGA